ncbi:hypothetical protein SCLCIDRAFT_318672 [Scleroderma citrinum Foug A]|uniref:Uncharacterized protein n=1 Tax=Scleroderma citrinum Foug A TaxID=1036808 RepID=A0A0C3DG55_9AGAM|nr:hypothetical protein SCLCIDRAFT_318672 [Scleroderma citrinum Foug A]
MCARIVARRPNCDPLSPQSVSYIPNPRAGTTVSWSKSRAQVLRTLQVRRSCGRLTSFNTARVIAIALVKSPNSAQDHRPPKQNRPPRYLHCKCQKSTDRVSGITSQHGYNHPSGCERFLADKRRLFKTSMAPKSTALTLAY